MANQKGFTLIELVIVVVVIGILATLALPKYQGFAASAKQSEAELLLKQVYTLQQNYYLKYRSYAASMNDLAQVGWAPPNPEHFFDPAVAEGGGPGSTTFMICILPRIVDLRSRSINEAREFGSC